MGKPTRASAAAASWSPCSALGIHVQAAIQWQKISAGDWTAYAADISDRADSHGPAGTIR